MEEEHGSVYKLKNWKDIVFNTTDTADETGMSFFKTALYRDGLKLSDHITETISYAVNHDMDEVVIFKITSSDTLITCKRIEYRMVLEEILSYLESSEEYERCSIVHSIIKSL